MKASELFIRSLEQVEKYRTPEPLINLFTHSAQLSRLNSEQEYRGQEGARTFWSEYLSLFKDIRSRFLNTVEAGNVAVLEWQAEGHFESGEPVQYRGVSIVEFDGEKVRAFRTYYDSAAFVQMAHR